MLRVSSRNARFQQFEALLGNRGKRQRNREFLVQGVRPITLAAEFGWPFRALIYDAERQLSSWARTMLADVPALHVAMSSDLLAALGEKEAGPPELVAVVEMPADDLFTVQWVKVSLPPEELPGYKAERVVCAECGEGINFQREVRRDGKILCRSCAGERYYEKLGSS